MGNELGELADKHFIDSVVSATLTACDKVSRIGQLGVVFKGGTVSRTFHDTILQELIGHFDGFAKGAASNDLSYKGTRWELKTSRTKTGCGIDRINDFENVRLIIVNGRPEENVVHSIRLLMARNEYFTPENTGTQIRQLNDLGRKKAVQIYPRGLGSSHY